MNDYKKRAIFELERGNYQQYHYFMKLYRLSRQEDKQTEQQLNKKPRRQPSTNSEKENSNPISNKRKKISSSERDPEKRSPKIVSHRAGSWNEMQRSFLRENYKRLSDAELGNCLGRSAEAVRCERKKLKLLRQTASRQWTADEDEFLLTNYKDMTFKDIGKKLDRKPKQVSARLAKLGGSKVNSYDLVINGNTVASGTIKQISEQLNANLYTVKRWRTDGVSWAEFIKLDQ